MINKGYDHFRPTLTARSEQSSLVLNYDTFIISEAPFSLDIKGHDIGSLASHAATLRGASERSNFNQISNRHTIVVVEREVSREEPVLTRFP